MLMSREIRLYPIQETIIQACRSEFRKHKRFILQAATGLGKTIIATWIINEVVRRYKRALFVCDRISLINQTSDVFNFYGLEHGIFQADNPMYDPMLPVQIGSIQTLSRRKQREYDFIVIDECHTWFKAHEIILKHNPDALVLGLSATPFTKGLGKYFESHIEPVPMRQLIKDGYLCEFEIYGPETINLSEVRTVAGEYREDDLSKAADKPELVADVVKTWKKLSNGLKTIVFSVNVAHGRHLEKEFRKAGINAKEINGYMPKDGMDGANQIIQDYRDSNFDVLISCEMLVKGFDVPDVECIVFATATKSPMKWIQAVGRGLRKSKGKDICRILDHGSNAERLGFPDEFEFLELDDGKKKDSKNKKEEPKEKLPKKCPSCDFIKPYGVRKCPACGLETAYMQEIETSEGELKKIQRKAKSEYTLEEKQSFLAQLNQYAFENNYKAGKNDCYGWALHKYQEKFGSEAPSRINWGKREPVGEDVKNFIRHLNIKYAKGKVKKMADTARGCVKCGGKEFKINQAGPHRKLSCAMCGSYIKFVNQYEETELKLNNQVKEN